MKTRLTLALASVALLAALIAGCTATVPAAAPSTPAAATDSTTEVTPTVAAGDDVEASDVTTATTVELTPTVASEEAASEEVASGEAVTSSTESTATTSVGLANPASQYCVDQGGTLTIEERGDGGQFGVCTFEDNLQCEEWAMMRGQCPVGGIKVTGYLTPAARYCAITGGEYSDNGTTSAEDEKGSCTFASGDACPAAAYYDGTCIPER